MQPVELAWVGGAHSFALPLGELRALQEATDKGPEELLNGIRMGEWKVDHLIQIIRWGLVGGGAMDASKAALYVTPLFDLHPTAKFKLTAAKILQHALFGPPDDPVGNGAGVTATAPENGASRPSTATVP